MNTSLFSLNVKRFSKIAQINFLKLFVKFDIPGDFYLLFLASIIGLLTGFGAYYLNLIVNGVHGLFFNTISKQLLDFPSSDYLRILFPAAGGLIVGLITYYLSPEVKGHGVPGVIESVSNKGGLIRRRVALITSITSGTTIGSGGSAGKEGPIVSIGAAIGSALGQFFHVSSDRLKILVGCGVAGGLAAVFNAPIAGVVFAVEVILADFSLKAFSPIIISSVIATAISRSFIGSSPIFEIPDYSLHSFAELPLYLLLGLIGGVVAALFTKILYWTEDLFEVKLKIRSYYKPMIGGLLMGIIAYWLPELYGFDDTAIHTALLGRNEIWILSVMVLAKILATSFTLGSGSTGGLFTPSLFIGAMFGALFGTIFNRLFPAITAPPGAYALVGMGIIVAGTIHAPLSALLIIFETTNDYHIILPLMLGTVASTLISRKIEKQSIYTKKILISGMHVQLGRNINYLRSRTIHTIVRKDIKTIAEDTSFTHILDMLINDRYSSFPVLNREKKVIGMVSMRDIQPILFDKELYPLLIARDVMSENILWLTEEMTMEEALKKVELGDYELLPVVNNMKELKYIGVLFHDDLIRLYRKEILLMTETND
jgi:CIC family chloride channel protein